METLDSPFTRLDEAHLTRLCAIVGEDHVLTHRDDTESWAHDYTEDFRFFPEAVVRPASTEEVSQVMRLCHEAHIPVTPAGARTGLSGGMLPVFGGVVLATDRLNRIVDIDTRNLQATVEPGVITQVFQEAVAEKGLFYPVDPASRGSCYIGGNLAESSGGMRAVKYGITKDYVLDLEVVLPNGEIIRTGARTLKNSTGYNLTQLMVGSEGTLGIITQAVFKLETLPTHRALLLIPFAKAEEACDAVSSIFYTGIIPSAIEFMEREAVDFAQMHLDHRELNTDGTEAMLIVECDGAHLERVIADCESVYEAVSGYEVGEILLAQTADEQERIWRIRRAIGEATKSRHVVKEEDTVVPRAELAKLWRFIKRTGEKYNFRTICWGHAGDGNLHCNILRTDQSDEEWREGLVPGIREIFEYTHSLGGTLSGEHGIGWVQKGYMDIVFGDAEMHLMKGIKELFDPKGILNPGKVFPS